MRTRLLLPTVLLATALLSRVAAQTPPPTPPPPAPPAPAPAEPAAAPAPAPAAAAVEPPPASEATIKSETPAAPAASKSADSNSLITVDFPDADNNTILRQVADIFDLNVIIPATVQGKTTIKLRNVTWRQIFKNVLDPIGFTYIENGNIINIISNDSLAKEPTSTEVFTLNYAKAADIKPTIDGLVDTSAGGKILIDTRSNSLVITERPTPMKRITAIIERLDRATDQVMIETKFVEVTDGDVRNLGVNWSVLKAYKIGASPAAQVNTTGGQNTSNGSTGSNDATNTATNGSTASQTLSSNNAVAGGVSTPTSTTSLQSAVNSSLTSTATDALNLLNQIANTNSINRTASVVFSADQFGFVLSALNELNRTKIISNPTIVTLNNTEATINVGESDPIPNYSYNEQRGSFEVNGFNYRDIGINLKVTPQVNARGDIKLSVLPEVSQKTGSVNFGGAGGAELPIVATRRVQTQISLHDGYTMGLGGLITSQDTNSSDKVPLLGNIPVLGYLFKQKSKNVSTTNLLIFITARTVPADGGDIKEIFDPRQLRSAGIRKDELPGFRDGSDPFTPPPPPPGTRKAK